ncbi:hypothetical protein M758_3G196400 [Ceratodon purpureus]|uniref:Uncharacterized protein n=1 Tax=Ceratodon purpureus TaxID=3225 RepID=A0A8T0IMS1_CERPU|nr:hypothetical protein KC19_3G197300 [Ceratodon purpureus]KAG0623722.1 hypothetical protein M758_3G196400 [Ceratodon purpureus]
MGFGSPNTTENRSQLISNFTPNSNSSESAHRTILDMAKKKKTTFYPTFTWESHRRDLRNVGNSATTPVVDSSLDGFRSGQKERAEGEEKPLKAPRRDEDKSNGSDSASLLFDVVTP